MAPSGGGRAVATAVDLRALPDTAGSGQPPPEQARFPQQTQVPQHTQARATISFDGLGQDDPVSARPSDVNAAAGAGDIVEVVNARVAAFTRTGGRRCAVPLAGLFGVAAELFNPRVLYDARYRRYSLLATVEPDAGAAATLFVATTRGADPCATWWAYRLAFSGPLFPPGTRLDRPNLGQDPTSLLLSSDNFRAGAYVGSAAFALAKSAIYAGVAVGYEAFAVPFATAPVTDQTAGAGDSYYLAAVPGRGYLLYRMLDSAGPDTVLLADASIEAPFVAPSRRIRQCGAGTLDPLDGRIAAPAVRADNFVWFAHGVDAGGRPGVRYGAISLVSHTAYVAVAARSRTSDDFNPSIAVADAGYGSAYVWLNWAFTDVSGQPCADVSAVADDVEPGGGVPDLVGHGTVFALSPGGSGADAPFGGYSSTVVEPTTDRACPTGWTAVLAQQYFGADGRWRTRLARVSSC
jgi:hypothetical protein